MKEIDGFKGRTIDGEPVSPAYVSLTSSGVKEEGIDFSGWFTSEEVAWDFFLKEKLKYTDGCSTIWWRKQPEVIKKSIFSIDLWENLSTGDKTPEISQSTLYTIYARLYAE